MSLNVEMVIEGGEGRQKTLSGFWRFEPVPPQYPDSEEYAGHQAAMRSYR